MIRKKTQKHSHVENMMQDLSIQTWGVFSLSYFSYNRSLYFTHESEEKSTPKLCLLSQLEASMRESVPEQKNLIYMFFHILSTTLQDVFRNWKWDNNCTEKTYSSMSDNNLKYPTHSNMESLNLRTTCKME